MFTINPYTKPIEAPVIDTYVPIPFEEMMVAGEMHQKRYDENVELYDEAREFEDTHTGLGKVRLPGTDEYVEFADKANIQEYMSGQSAKLDVISSKYPDKTNPEYKSEIKAYIRSTKKALGPEGVVGRAAAAKAELAAFQKKVDKNPQLADKPWLYMPYINELKRAAKASQTGESGLSLAGPISEGVDVSGELSIAMKNLGSRFLGGGAEKYTDIPGLYRALKEHGVDETMIRNAVRTHFNANLTLTGELGKQAAYINMRGGDTSVEELVKVHTDNMIATFQQSTMSTSTFEDFRAKKLFDSKLKRQEEINNRIGGTINLGKPGSGIANPKEMVEAKQLATASVDKAKNEYITYGESIGIKFNAQGEPVTTTVNGEDRSSELQVFKDRVKEAEIVAKSYDKMDARAREEAGFTNEYRSTPEYKAAYAVASESVYKQAADEEEHAKAYRYAYTPSTEAELEQKIEDLMARQGDKKLKKYASVLEEMNKSDVFKAGYLPVTEGTADALVDLLTTQYQDPNSMQGALMSASSEYIGTNYKEDASAFEDRKLNISKTKISGGADITPKVIGIVTDDAQGGLPVVVYKVFNKEGGHGDYVKIPAPKSLITNLINSGDIENADLMINYQLKSVVGALGPRNVESDVNLDLTGNDPSAPVITVKDKGLGHPHFQVIVPGREAPVIIETEDQVITYLSSLAKQRLVDWIKEQKKKNTVK